MQTAERRERRALPGRAAHDLSPRMLLAALLLALTGFYFTLALDSYTDDFRAYYVATLAVHDGLDPYVNHVQVDERYADGTWLRADSRYIYPPTALLLLAPLAHVHYRPAKILWGLFVPLVMAGTLLALSRRFPRRMLVLLALFISMPLFMNIDYGQSDCIILALTLAAFLLGDGVAAGVCLGLAIALKFSPVLTLVWFAGSRRWRTVAAALATDTLLAGIALGRWGTGYFREFFANMLSHHGGDHEQIAHHFSTLSLMRGRYISTADGLFTYQHPLGGWLQNPFGVGSFSHVAGPAVYLAFAAWLFLSRAGRRLPVERSFFLFLIFGMLANHLLWPMGLVMSFPLVLLLIDESPVPNLASVLLLLPLFLIEPVAGSLNFTLLLAAIAYCIWRNGWLRPQGPPGLVEELAVA